MCCLSIWKIVSPFDSRQNFIMSSGLCSCFEARQCICQTENCSPSLCL
jgi:hypothetical protein